MNYAWKSPANLYPNKKYKQYFTIFKFGEEEEEASNGITQDIGIRNAFIFDNPLLEDSTLAHEAYHGLGLEHTHFNEDNLGNKINPSPSQKYIYIKTETDNICSYGGAIRKTTWKWQWEIRK